MSGKRQPRIRRLAWSVLTLVALMATSGCGSSQPSTAPPAPKAASAPTTPAPATPAPATPAPATPAPKPAPTTPPPKPVIPLKVGLGALAMPYAPFRLAKETGAFKKYGLDVELLQLQGGGRAIQAMMSGESPIVVAGGSAAILSRLQGSDAVIVGSVLQTLADLIIAKPEIKTIRDLKGKRIGINAYGSIADVEVRLMLQKNGLDPEKDVNIMQFGNFPEIIAAMQKGAIDAGVSFEPLVTQAKKAGFYVLFDTAQLGVDFVTTSINTRGSYLKANRDVVKSFMKAYYEGVNSYFSDKPLTLRVIKDYMKLTDDVAVENGYNYYATVIRRNPLTTAAGIKMVLTTVQDQEPKAAQAKPEEFMDMSLLEELATEGFIKK